MHYFESSSSYGFSAGQRARYCHPAAKVRNDNWINSLDAGSKMPVCVELFFIYILYDIHLTASETDIHIHI